MSNKIIEKYKDLYEACKKYPKIVLSNKLNERPKVYREPKGYAKGGFIEKFCKEKNGGE